jgi:hypothetical protein
MDPSKFFNRKINIRNPETPYNKGKFVDESENYSNRVSSRINQSPLTKSLFSLRNKVFQIENLLNGIFSLDKKKQEQNKKIKAAEVPDRKPKTKGPQIFGNLIQRPKTGALDLIKDFVTFTFLGWLFTRIQPLLGGLTKLGPLLEGMSWFIGGTLKNMVDVFATFLKLGFDAKEKFDSIAEDIKKNTKGIDKVFDSTLNPLKAVFTGVIQLANSFLAVSVKEDELNEAKTQLAKEQSADTVPAMPPLPKVDEPRMPQTSDSFTDSPKVQKLNTGGVIRGYNEGGRIDPKTPITRGVETQRREVPKPKPVIQPQKSDPGKDVGGKKKIKGLYDQGTTLLDFIPLSSFFRSDKKSGFVALTGASEEYKKPMADDILGIGNMMGASVDSALGQKIEKKSYTQFADGIKYLVNYGRTQPEEFAKIDLEDMVRKIVEPKVNMAINRIQEEINKKSAVEITPGPGEGGGYEEGDLAAGAVSPSELFKEIGASTEQWDIFRNSIALIESKGDYSVFGGSGDFYDGRYQMGEEAKIDGAKVANVKFPGHSNDPNSHVRVSFRNNPQLQETLFTGFTVANHRTLMRNPKYASASVERKLEILGYAHNQGAGGANNWLNTGKVGSDGFGTKGTKYTELIADNFRKKLRGETLQISSGAISLSSGTGNIPKADYIKGVFDQSDEPGFDVTWKGDNNIAILPGRVKEVGMLYGANYGNVVVIESIDPVNGKKVDVLYSHFPTGGISVKEGQTVSIGQVLGRMGKPGERGIGNITGQHASIDFYSPNRGRGQITGRYSRWQGLAREVISSAQTGNLPRNWKTLQQQSPQTSQQIQTPRQPPRTPLSGPLTPLASSDRRGFQINNQMYYIDIKTGIITNAAGYEIKVGPGSNEALGKAILQRLTPSDRQKLEKLKKQQDFKNIPWWGRMLPGISSIKPVLPAEKYVSYNQPDSQEPSYIQPLIINNPIPVPVSSGPVAFVNPRISNPIPIT